MQDHALKTWPKLFDSVLDGSKAFEYRINDRNFKKGDTLWLKEYDPSNISSSYTGRNLRVIVQRVWDKTDLPWLPNNFCIMSIKLIQCWST